MRRPACFPAVFVSRLWASQDVRSDIFAFGLCMLELLTLKQLDPQHCVEVPQLLQQVRVSNTGGNAAAQCSADVSGA